MTKKKRIINPNIIANPVILPDPKDMIDSTVKVNKKDSHKVSLGPHSK